MKAELFPYARPKKGGSSPWTCPREDDGRAKGRWWVCLKRMWAFPWACLREDDGHAKGGWWVCLKRMWSFPWVCLGRMVIPLGVSKRGSGHSLDGPNEEWSFS